jgi:hypothetical protein
MFRDESVNKKSMLLKIQHLEKRSTYVKVAASVKCMTTRIYLTFSSKQQLTKQWHLQTMNQSQ